MLLSGISTCFQVVSQSLGQIAHVLLTHPPLASNKSSRRNLWIQLARLACIRHAASVRPEPGSNSQFENWVFLICSRLFACELTSLICLDQTMFDPHTAKLCSVFKVPTCVLVTQRFISYSLVDSLSTSFWYLFFVSPANSFFTATTNISILVISERSNPPFHSLYHGYSRQSCNKRCLIWFCLCLRLRGKIFFFARNSSDYRIFSGRKKVKLFIFLL